MIRKTTFLAAAVALTLVVASASAQSGDHNMMAMNDYMAAMKKMDQAMMTAKGATPDQTFARKMIVHHQGAIEMSQIQLRHGTDAEAKRMAQKTIDENTKGIAELERWLKSHGG